MGIYKCPKHVEQIISAINIQLHLVGFLLYAYTTMHGQTYIKFTELLLDGSDYVFYQHYMFWTLILVNYDGTSYVLLHYFTLYLYTSDL